MIEWIITVEIKRLFGYLILMTRSTRRQLITLATQIETKKQYTKWKTYSIVV